MPTADTSENNVPIHCELYHKFHEEQPYYEALSYTWGDAEHTLPVFINGHQHDVTKNLYTALEHIRGETEDVHIWVDALCINQQDDAEKSEQVKKMKDIYADAARTIVWLGPGHNKLEEVIAELNLIGSFVYEEGILDMLITFGMLTSDDQHGYQTTEEAIKIALSAFLDESLNNLPRTQKLLEGFAEFLSQPYWERVWILQEIVISQNVLIRTGQSTIPFQHFHAVHMYISFMSVHVSSIIHARLLDLLPTSTETEEFNLLYQQFMNMCAVTIPKAGGRIAGMRKNHQRFLAKDPSANVPPRLTQLLAKVFIDQTPKATNDKDRIYALLGMASDFGELKIQPNYSPGVTEMDVYTQVAKVVLSLGHIDFLSFAQCNGEEMKEGPSWVPDWRYTIYRPSGQLPWATLFDACGSQVFLVPEDVSGLLPGQIKLSGFILDKVQTLAPTPWKPTEEGVTKHHAAVSTYLSDIITLCNMAEAKLATLDATTSSARIPSVSIHDRQTAFFRVPVADQEEYGIGFLRRATSALYPSYHAVAEELNRNQHPVQTSLPEVDDDFSGGGQTVPSGRYYNALSWQRNRHAFVSEKGFVGLGAVGIEVGDTIVILKGAKFPYILREVELSTFIENSPKCYKFIGEAYVHGIMYGEVFPGGGRPTLNIAEEAFILI